MADSPAEGLPSERARVGALRVLGLPRSAGSDEVRRTYLRLARELHPDLHPDEPAVTGRFQRVAAAYELLRRYHRRMAQQPAGTRRGDRVEPRWWSAFGDLV